MNGSSGGSYSPSRERVEDLVKRKRRETDTEAYEVDVNRLLEETLRDLNDRDVIAVRRHIDGVKRALEAEGIGTIDLLFGGSVSKHTYVDGLSDIDILAIVNRSDRMGRTPQELIETFADRLRQRFPGLDVTPGRLAVTVRYRDGVELQILPALSTPDGIRIASSNGSGWSRVIRPDAFASKLTAVNQANHGRVVPVIKLFKAIIESVADAPTLSGYHVESLAIEAFERYTGRTTRMAMLEHLVSRSAELVMSPIKDGTGQSIHVDEYLGDANSRQRQDAATRLRRISKRIDAANRESDITMWREILTEG